MSEFNGHCQFLLRVNHVHHRASLRVRNGCAPVTVFLRVWWYGRGGLYFRGFGPRSGTAVGKKCTRLARARVAESIFKN